MKQESGEYIKRKQLWLRYEGKDLLNNDDHVEKAKKKVRYTEEKLFYVHF